MSYVQHWYRNPVKLIYSDLENNSDEFENYKTNFDSLFRTENMIFIIYLVAVFVKFGKS